MRQTATLYDVWLHRLRTWTSPGGTIGDDHPHAGSLHGVGAHPVASHRDQRIASRSAHRGGEQSPSNLSYTDRRAACVPPWAMPTYYTLHGATNTRLHSLILLAGDIEQNPGPTYPAALSVGRSTRDAEALYSALSAGSGFVSPNSTPDSPPSNTTHPTCVALPASPSHRPLPVEFPLSHFQDLWARPIQALKFLKAIGMVPDPQ
jgi:hypothetical protein